MLLPASGATPLFAHGSVPPHLLARFTARKAFIFLLEAIAQLLPLLMFPELLRGPFWAFVDNDAARHALAKGYSGNVAANALISTYWCAAAASGASPWFERVASKANLSDEVSRGEFAFARARGWRQVHFDLSATWHRLTELIVSESFQVDGLVKAIFADLAVQRSAQGMA